MTLINPPRNDICDTKFLGFAYVTWSPNAAKEAIIPPFKCVASVQPLGLLPHLLEKFSFIGMAIYLVTYFSPWC